jgi:hypothetical protein
MVHTDIDEQVAPAANAQGATQKDDIRNDG